MNIIEKVRDIVFDYPQIKDFNRNVHIDITFPDTENFGLSPTGDEIIHEDILGNQTRRHSFTMYSYANSFNDYLRLQNSTFMLEFSYYLEKYKKNDEIEVNTGSEVIQATLTKISASNQMVYSVPTSDLNDGVIYQLQIYAEYKVKGEG